MEKEESTPPSSKKRKRKRPRTEATTVAINSSIVHVPQTNTTLRIIEPYLHTFASFAKARWIGRTLLDVYSTEFGSHPSSYYEAAIRDGRIRVSGNIASLDYRIQGKDELSHLVHRHEPAVAVSHSDPPHVTIVKETDSIVAIDKPSTIPIHPCGGYRKNSLFELLEDESSYGKLYTIHRLDRLTSGLVVAAKTSTVAQEWAQAIVDRHQCEKFYLARVHGQFGLRLPDSIPMIATSDTATTPPVVPNYGEWSKPDDQPLPSSSDNNHRQGLAYCYWLSHDSAGHGTPVACPMSEFIHQKQKTAECCMNPSSLATEEQSATPLLWLHLACPVRIADPKNGVCEAGNFQADKPHCKRPPRSAQTSFTPLSYDTATDTTVLLVRPATGRTHQIRIHLQHLGHPIANDPNYNGDDNKNSIWFGNPNGQKACSVAEAALEQSPSARVTSDEPATEAEIAQLPQTTPTTSLEDLVKATCVWCARDSTRSFAERATLEFQVRSPGLWLHALQYTVKGNRFCTPVPLWATPQDDDNDESSSLRKS